MHDRVLGDMDYNGPVLNFGSYSNPRIFYRMNSFLMHYLELDRLILVN